MTDTERLNWLEKYLMAYLTDHHVMVWNRMVKACQTTHRDGRPTLREAIDAAKEREGK